MNRKLLAVACVSLIALAACKPEPVEPAVAPDTATAAAEPTTPELTPSAESLSSDAAPAFDQKAFAGTFSGTLPCASCTGIDTTLALNADGTFALAEDPQGSDDAHVAVDGTWTVEADNQHIRLDPNSKTAEDRLYAITSNDEIEQLGADGKPAASGLDYRLKRGR